MTRYLKLFYHLFVFNVRAAMEYRLNFLMKIFYGPAYVGVLFLVLNVAYLHANSLAGWSRPETFLLFAVYQLMYTFAVLLFMQSIRYYMWEGFRYGAFDSIMTKPVNVQFMATFTRPEMQQIPLLLAIFALFLSQFSVLNLSVFSANFLLFMFSFILSIGVFYFFVTTLMTLGFYVMKAVQVIEFYDKITDNAQYPTTIFPEALQTIFFTIIPIAFLGYVPTGILLGKLGTHWFGYLFLMIVCLYAINQLAWKAALRHYSSASS